MALGGLAALLMGGLGAWVSRRWARPYVQLFDAVAERLPAGPQGQAGGAALEALLRSLRNAPVAVEPASPGERLLVQALHDAERIKTMLDGLPAPVYVTDAQQHLVYWNRQAAEVFGWVQAVDLGRPLQEVLHWIGEDGARIDPPAMPAPGSTGPHWMHEAHVRRRDGTDLWGEWRVGWVFDGAGQPVGLLSKVRDTTAEREARERLTEQTETLSAVIQASSDALISTDEAGRVVLFNPAAERIFEVPAQEMLGQPLDRLLPQRHRAAHAGQMQGFADSQTTRRRMGVGRVTGVRPDGQELELEASISQVRVRGRKVLTAILRDVTERVRAERMQLQYQMDLSELAHQLMDQEQKTARRMAQLLHDRLGQTLAALRLSFDALSVQLQDFAGGLVRDRIGTIDRLAHQAIEDVREAMNELRPPFLEDHGLAAALQNECLQRETEAGTARLSTRVAPAVRTQRWPADVEHAAFMVGREALINAIRHAQAYHITVVLEGDAGHLSLQVVDDGLGIAPALQAGKPGHLGVVGMRERALAIGARLELRPASDAQERPGTAVCLHWEDAAG